MSSSARENTRRDAKRDAGSGDAGKKATSEMSEPNDDAEFINSLAAMLKEHGLAEIEVSRVRSKFDKLNVRVSGRTLASREAVPQLPRPATQDDAGLVAEFSEAKGEDADRDSVPDAAADPQDEAGMVRSPMIGTVYLQPDPGAQKFADVGDAVKEGDTLVIVEAMKTMNHIPSPFSGTVKRVLVQDGTPVEYGSPIMIIE